jgi:hypothetical protein
MLTLSPHAACWTCREGRGRDGRSKTSTLRRQLRKGKIDELTERAQQGLPLFEEVERG